MAKDEEKGLTMMSTRDKVLHSAAILFMEKGYEKTSIREIAHHAGVNRGSVVFAIKNKEKLLEILTAYVLEKQFEASRRVIAGKTEDKILHYAAETTMQLYMAEGNRQIRELYAVAYTLPGTSELIYKMVTDKLEPIFKEYNPDWEIRDFYEREIASGSIIRGYMAKTCDHYFTMSRKVEAFLRTSLAIYNVPTGKIEEAIGFVSRLDFEAIAGDAIDSILCALKARKPG